MEELGSFSTGRAAFSWGAEFLRDKGFARDTALFEARLLLALAWNKKSIELVTSLDQQLGAKAREEFKGYIQRRGDGEPLEYILGEQEFMGLSFKVTPAVLIPRRDTEVLVQAALEFLKTKDRARILELGTGSGAIGISLVCRLPAASVVAVDISAEALSVARENAARLGAAGRIAFLAGDLFKPLPPGSRYDLILSNPPYISKEEYPDLPEDVKREPALALLGGVDGLNYYRRIAPGSYEYLEPGGGLILEIGWQQARAVSTILGEAGYGDIYVLRDQGGRDRAVIARKP